MCCNNGGLHFFVYLNWPSFTYFHYCQRHYQYLLQDIQQDFCLDSLASWQWYHKNTPPVTAPIKSTIFWSCFLYKHISCSEKQEDTYMLAELFGKTPQLILLLTNFYTFVWGCFLHICCFLHILKMQVGLNWSYIFPCQIELIFQCIGENFSFWKLLFLHPQIICFQVQNPHRTSALFSLSPLTLYSIKSFILPLLINFLKHFLKHFFEEFPFIEVWLTIFTTSWVW